MIAPLSGDNDPLSGWKLFVCVLPGARHVLNHINIGYLMVKGILMLIFFHTRASNIYVM